MSISGDTPYYLLASKRDDGLIDYALMNPRGWGSAELVHSSISGARDEEQMLGRVQHLVPPWQDEIRWHWVAAKDLPPVD